MNISFPNQTTKLVQDKKLLEQSVLHRFPEQLLDRARDALSCGHYHRQLEALSATQAARSRLDLLLWNALQICRRLLPRLGQEDPRRLPKDRRKKRNCAISEACSMGFMTNLGGQFSSQSEFCESCRQTLKQLDMLCPRPRPSRILTIVQSTPQVLSHPGRAGAVLFGGFFSTPRTTVPKFMRREEDARRPRGQAILQRVQRDGPCLRVPFCMLFSVLQETILQAPHRVPAPESFEDDLKYKKS